uniref:DUF4283 domain-containing protein n=1 Tax=Ananas comosus var. bracteatus TaxID=296719 RepID=A0A6V7PF57_ANACO|nr:unnamed protein product [Ananas comosus var. bracteatus]
MEPLGPSSGRRSSIAAFLPSRPPPVGQPSLAGCVARVEVLGFLSLDTKEVISRGLATRFGGSPRDFKVASGLASSMPVFFPNWLAREFAIGCSPLRFGNSVFRFANWSETGEVERGHLKHMAWIRLLHWPILCWNCEDVKAAISGFGELWEVDTRSEGREDEVRIPIEVDSWEETNPIFLGEELDERLGLVLAEAQEELIRQTGFSSIPRMGAQGSSGSEMSRRAEGGQRHKEDSRQLRLEWRPIAGVSSNSFAGVSSNSNSVAGVPPNLEHLSTGPNHFCVSGVGKTLAPCRPRHASPTPPSASISPLVLDSMNCGLSLGPPPSELASESLLVLDSRNGGLSLGPSAAEEVRPIAPSEDYFFPLTEAPG